jgi:hypothetical protein
MDKKTSELLFQTASEIESLLNKYPTPVPNDWVPKRIRFLADQLRARDTYAAEKAHQIASLSAKPDVVWLASAILQACSQMTSLSCRVNSAIHPPSAWRFSVGSVRFSVSY